MIDLTGYKLTFDEEFNTRSISQNGVGTVWADIRPASRLNANADIGFGNSAFVDPASGIDPFSLQNGALRITAIRTDAEVVGPGDWASGLISSKASFAQTYGFFEMRAALPVEAGVWPAFWMLAANGTWPPEIDILEAYGDTSLWQYVHSASGVTQVWSSHAGMTAGYHSYGMEWGPTTISFYFDGERVGGLQTPSDLHGPMYLLADLAMQRGVAGTTDTAKHMDIDYIRAYSADTHAVAVALDTVSSPDGAATGHLYGATAAGSTTQPPASCGTGLLSLRVSGDHHAGSPQFQLIVDGVPVGGTQSVQAVHVRGEWQQFDFAGAFGAGAAHAVEVRFLNDAWDGKGGGEGHDRNLYVQSLTLNGTAHSWTEATGNIAPWSTDSAAIATNGSLVFGTGSSVVSPPPVETPPTPVDPPVQPVAPSNPGSGPAALSLRVSSDHYQGGAAFQLVVDGVPIGGVQTVDAVHVLGQWQQFDFAGPFDAAAAHAVEVRFLNDAWDGHGGGEGHDRNLYVQSMTLNGTTQAWTTATGDVAPWSTDSAAIAANGSIVFGHSSAGPVQHPSQPSQPAPTVPAVPVDAPPPTVPGSSAVLSIAVSGDHYAGAPQFRVRVDGAAVGAVQTVDAVHVLGQWQTFDFGGSFAPGAHHEVEILFLNDAWDGKGGGEGHDRNLFVESVSLNGETLHWAAATGPIAPWSTDSAALATNGGALFEFI